MYFLTTIIPFYNGANQINEVIDTLKKQTLGFENIEIILVNDCSTDNSVEIAEDIVSKYDNCKFYDLSLEYDEKSGYPGRPRNLGLKHVSSDYVLFLDIDDYYVDDAFEILYNTIKETKVDFVLANHYINSDNGSIKMNLCPKNSKDKIIVTPLENQSKYDKVTTGCFISAWGKLFNYDFICKHGLTFFEDGPTEDADFYFQALAVCDKICILPNSHLYMYNEFGESTIHNTTEKLFLAFLNGLIRVNDFLNENIDFDHSVFLSEYFSSLLLIFTTLDVTKEKKMELLNMIYDFEQSTNEIDIKPPEIRFLNNLIIKRKFKLAITVSKLYNQLYNNNFVKKVYRKYLNTKRVE